MWEKQRAKLLLRPYEYDEMIMEEQEFPAWTGGMTDPENIDDLLEDEEEEEDDEDEDEWELLIGPMIAHKHVQHDITSPVALFWEILDLIGLAFRDMKIYAMGLPTAEEPPAYIPPRTVWITRDSFFFFFCIFSYMFSWFLSFSLSSAVQENVPLWAGTGGVISSFGVL